MEDFDYGRDLMRWRKMAVIVGRQIQEIFPDAPSLYISLGSLRAAAEVLEKRPGYEQLGIDSFAILHNALRCALLGNNDSELGDKYKGLMKKSKYDDQSVKNRENAREAIIEKLMEERGGIFGQTSEELVDAARAAAKAMGRVPWEDYEIARAYELKDEGIREKDIASMLNDQYHKGSCIRNKNKVNMMFRRQEGRV